MPVHIGEYYDTVKRRFHGLYILVLKNLDNSTWEKIAQQCDVYKIIPFLFYTLRWSYSSVYIFKFHYTLNCFCLRGQEVKQKELKNKKLMNRRHMIHISHIGLMEDCLHILLWSGESKTGTLHNLTYTAYMV
jgi:hypothetical protein